MQSDFMSVYGRGVAYFIMYWNCGFIFAIDAKRLMTLRVGRIFETHIHLFSYRDAEAISHGSYVNFAHKIDVNLTRNFFLLLKIQIVKSEYYQSKISSSRIGCGLKTLPLELVV